MQNENDKTDKKEKKEKEKRTKKERVAPDAKASAPQSLGNPHLTTSQLRGDTRSSRSFFPRSGRTATISLPLLITTSSLCRSRESSRGMVTQSSSHIAHLLVPDVADLFCNIELVRNWSVAFREDLEELLGPKLDGEFGERFEEMVCLIS